MTQGEHLVGGDIGLVRDRIRIILAAANCRTQWKGASEVEFRHGTLLTQTATMIPKRGRMTLSRQGDQVRIDWAVESVGFAKWWLIIWGVLFCWLIFPPFVAYHVVVRKPEEFMSNLLAGV